jgi:hypothetical protein
MQSFSDIREEFMAIYAKMQEGKASEDEMQWFKEQNERQRTMIEQGAYALSEAFICIWCTAFFSIQSFNVWL